MLGAKCFPNHILIYSIYTITLEFLNLVSIIRGTQQKLHFVMVCVLNFKGVLQMPRLWKKTI